MLYNNGLAEDCSSSTASEMDLLQSCTKPSIYSCTRIDFIVFVPAIHENVHGLGNLKSQIDFTNALCAQNWNFIKIIFPFVVAVMIKSSHKFAQSQQLSCQDMCKVVSWFHPYFEHKSNTNFCKIWIKHL